MQLVSLEFHDPKAGWSLRKADFFPDVTLLVGLSGVGKSRILNSIQKLVKISQGRTSLQFFGLKWELTFSHDGDDFVWTGEFERGSQDEEGQAILNYPFIDEDEIEAPKAQFTSEVLLRNGEEVARRDSDNIFLDGTATPKLSAKESLIHILKNEPSITKAYAGLDSILFVDHSENHPRQTFSFGRNFESLKRKYKTIESIREQDMPTHLKLALAYENCREVFDEIAVQFQQAFPYVEEVGVQLVEMGPFGMSPKLYLRERRVEQQIPEEKISSGMHRTLMHLSRMALWPDGTVVLIDEFENSFGVNCIHFVTADLQIHSQRMQFILTSHHPYIINNIDKKNWKIVSRDGQTVVVEGAEILRKGSSHHEAFLQLLNLPQYSEGITVE